MSINIKTATAYGDRIAKSHKNSELRNVLRTVLKTATDNGKALTISDTVADFKQYVEKHKLDIAVLTACNDKACYTDGDIADRKKFKLSALIGIRLNDLTDADKSAKIGDVVKAFNTVPTVYGIVSLKSELPIPTTKK
jgi:hypothetical protein